MLCCLLLFCLYPGFVFALWCEFNARLDCVLTFVELLCWFVFWMCFICFVWVVVCVDWISCGWFTWYWLFRVVLILFVWFAGGYGLV